MLYLTLAERINPKACHTRLETRSTRSRSNSASFSPPIDVTAIGPVPAPRLCVNCKRDGAVARRRTRNGMTQPWRPPHPRNHRAGGCPTGRRVGPGSESEGGTPHCGTPNEQLAYVYQNQISEFSRWSAAANVNHKVSDVALAGNRCAGERGSGQRPSCRFRPATQGRRGNGPGHAGSPLVQTLVARARDGRQATTD